MILTCPACSTRYLVDPLALSAAGRTVRCARCSESWFQAPPDGDPIEVEAADDAAFPTETAAPSPVTRGPQVARPMPPGSNLPALPGSHRSRPSWLGWAALAIVVAGLLTGGVVFRDSIVAIWPPAERIYALANLPLEAPQGPVFDLRNIDFERGMEAGQSVLRITGEVINLTDSAKLVPRLRVSVSDAAKNELRHWTVDIPPRELQPGEGAAFTTRLVNPPDNARQLSVTVLSEG